MLAHAHTRTLHVCTLISKYSEKREEEVRVCS